MLATPWPHPFDDEGWWFELKWDGYRCLATGGTRTRLRSRRGLDLADRFPDVASIPIPEGWTLDGEIVVLDPEGRPDFSLLQAGGRATYVAFDLLDGPDSTFIDRPFEDRRDRLVSLDLDRRIVVTEPVAGEGVALYDAVAAQGLEGIVAKRSGSRYLPGRRSPDWRKIANRNVIRAVVGGWLPGEGGRSSTFGSLLVGLWRGDALRWVGAVGSGFSDAQLGPIMEALRELERPSPPFEDVSAVPAGARWVDPGLVIAVEYKEWTRDDRLRAPVYKGLESVPSSEVTWESERPG